MGPHVVTPAMILPNDINGCVYPPLLPSCRSRAAANVDTNETASTVFGRFHSTCLYKWFHTSHKNKCPICQQTWA